MSVARAVTDVVGQVVRRVLVEPVRTGRLRSDGWPAGLAPVVGIGLAVYVLALVGAVLARPLRGWLPHDSEAGFPPAVLPALVVMVAVVVALVATGALHAPPVLRIVGLAVPLVVGIGISAWTLTWWSILVQLGVWLVLVVFAVIRARRPYAWWEYVVVQAVIGAGFVLAARSGIRPALDGQYLDSTNIVILLLGSVALFALPTTVVAGLAVSELAVTTSAWVVETVTTRLRLPVLTGLTIVLGVVALGSVAWAWWRSALPVVPHLVTTVITAVVGGLTVLVWRAADRASDRVAAGSTTVPDLVRPARRVAVVVAVLLTLPVVVATAVLTVQLGLRIPAEALGWSAIPDGSVGLPEISSAQLRGAGSLLAALVAVLAATRAVRRGGRGTAELFGVVAVLAGVRGAGQLGWLPVTPSLDDLAALGVLVVVITGARWWVRTSITRRRLEALALAFLLAVAVSRREQLADPLAALLGGGTGVLLAVGLLWALLTGAEDANGDSVRFPRPARTLLVVANLALVMTVYAFNQLGVGRALQIDVFVAEGSDVIGTALVVAALWAVLGAGIRGDEVVEASPESQVRSRNAAT